MCSEKNSGNLPALLYFFVFLKYKNKRITTGPANYHWFFGKYEFAKCSKNYNFPWNICFGDRNENTLHPGLPALTPSSQDSSICMLRVFKMLPTFESWHNGLFKNTIFFEFWRKRLFLQQKNVNMFSKKYAVNYHSCCISFVFLFSKNKRNTTGGVIYGLFFGKNVYVYVLKK